MSADKLMGPGDNFEFLGQVLRPTVRAFVHIEIDDENGTGQVIILDGIYFDHEKLGDAILAITDAVG